VSDHNEVERLWAKLREIEKRLAAVEGWQARLDAFAAEQVRNAAPAPPALPPDAPA
jgi:hypothetical protein